MTAKGKVRASAGPAPLAAAAAVPAAAAGHLSTAGPGAAAEAAGLDIVLGSLQDLWQQGGALLGVGGVGGRRPQPGAVWGGEGLAGRRCV